MWLGVIACLVICVLAAAMVVLLMRRPNVSTGAPTTDDSKIHVVRETERAAIDGATLSGAKVKELSDGQLEDSINKPLPPPK